MLQKLQKLFKIFEQKVAGRKCHKKWKFKMLPKSKVANCCKEEKSA